MKNMKSRYNFVAKALRQNEGVSFYGMGKCDNGETLYLVISKIDGEYQAKLAFNADDLQCDYDVDWIMPYAENGDVYDTDTTIDDDPELFDWDYWLGEAETIKSLVNQGEIGVENASKSSI